MIRFRIRRALVCLCLVCLLLPTAGWAASVSTPVELERSSAPEGAVGGIEARIDIEVFLERLLAMLRQRAPEVIFTPGEDGTFTASFPDGREQRYSLDYVYGEYTRYEGAAEDILVWYTERTLERLGYQVERPRVKSFLPVIRNQTYLEALWEDHFSPIPERLGLDGLYILYVEDRPGGAVLMEEDELNNIAVDYEELRAVATENLMALLPEAELVEVEGLGIGSVGLDGVYESSLLLVPPGELYEYPVEGELVVAVPARDAFFLADSADPASVAVLRGYAKTVFAESGYPVTDRLIVWRDGAFAWFEEE